MTGHWGRTCWHPGGKSNGTGGGWDSNSSVGTPTLQLMDRYDLDADFLCRVFGVGRGWGLRLVSTCCFVIPLYIQYKSRTLFGQFYLTMVPNHPFGRRLTGMYGNHPKGETTWNLQLQWNIIEISSSAKWSEQEANSTSGRFVEGFYFYFLRGGREYFPSGSTIFT